MARRRGLGSGRKRHWSQAALAAAGGAAKMVRRGVHMARAVRRVRRVVRRTMPGRRRAGAAGKGDHVGVFTKCWNKKVYRRRRSAGSRAFAKRVRSVLSTDLSKVTALTERSLFWGFGQFAGAGTPPNVPRQRVGWMQVGLGVLSGQDYIQAYYDPYAASATNPAGLSSVAISGNVNANNQASSSGVYSTVAQVFSSVRDQGNPALVTQGVHRFRLGPRRMHMSLRNPCSYGFWIDIFYLKARKSTRLNDVIDAPMGSVGTNYYVTGSATQKFYGSPLECMAHGYAFTSDLGVTYHGLTKQASPQESPTFRRYWTCTKKCRVYLPPGGTLEKALVQKFTRNMTSDYVSQYTMDKCTEYLLFKCVPEIQIGNGAAIVAEPVQTGQAVEGLVGDVNWRYSFRQVQQPEIYDEIGVSGYVPMTTTLKAGQFEPTSRVL